MNTIKNKTIAIVLSRWSNYSLIALTVACALTYLYLTNVTVHILKSVETAKLSTQSLVVELSEMESKRLLFGNKITAETARHLGLVEVSTKTFIVNKSQKTAFSYKFD